MQGSVYDIFLCRKENWCNGKKDHSLGKTNRNNCEAFERLYTFSQDNKKNISDFTELKTQMG